MGRREPLLHSFGLFWMLAALAGMSLIITLYAVPDALLRLYPFRDQSGYRAALDVIEFARPLGFGLVAGAALAAFYFRDAARRVRPVTGALPNVTNTPAAPGFAGWKWGLLLGLAGVALALWLLPIGDGLQDDEADKLRVVVGTWDYWVSNFFNTRVNILPITVARLVHVITATREEWVLRLAVFSVFTAPLLFMWLMPLRRRYGYLAAAFLLLFFGLHISMGEYASKVQGYLPVLMFAVLQFVLWTAMLKRPNGVSPVLGVAWLLACVGGYLTHNFVILFIAAQIGAAFLLDMNARWSGRGVHRAAAIIVGYGSLLMVVMGVFLLFGLRSVLFHLGLSGDGREIVTVAEGLEQVLIAMTGNTGWAALAFLLVYGAAFVYIWRTSGRTYRAELYLALLALTLVVLCVVIIRPRFFIARFFIWLPMIWLILLSLAAQRVMRQLLMVRGVARPLVLAGTCIGLLLAVLPSQITWQAARTAGVNLRKAAQKAFEVAQTYEATGANTGYLLLSSYGNYAHRMWFYLPDEDMVSDRDIDATQALRTADALDKNVWIVPAALGQLSGSYAWVKDEAIRTITAGNMTLYVIPEYVIPG